MPHHLGKAVSEDLVRRSGLAWTILQPGAYLQNLDVSGPIEVPYYVDAVFGFADLADVAEVAALVLTEDGHARCDLRAGVTGGHRGRAGRRGRRRRHPY